MIYHDGIWREISKELVEQKVVSFLDSKLDGQYASRTMTGVERLFRTRLAQELLRESPGLLPFANGVLNLATMQLSDHRPDYHFLWQLPYDYDEQATCPETLTFLHQAVGNRCEQVQVLRGYAKAVITRRLDLQRYLELIGAAGTGKSTFVRILHALVGLQNLVITELKHLEGNRFELGDIRGKVLLSVTDSERYGGTINTLKAITGQDFIRLEEKFKRRHQDIAQLMVVIAANEPIQSQDYSNGLVRRRLSMVFNHVPATQKDLLFYQDGSWHGDLADEIPGIMNWVLAMTDDEVHALVKHTTHYAPSLLHSWSEAIIDTNPLAEWANHALIKADGDSSNVGEARKLDGSNRYDKTTEWLYANYRQWSDDHGHRYPVASNRFTGILNDLLTNQLKLQNAKRHRDMHGSQFLGIRLRGEYDNAIPPLITPMTGHDGSMTGNMTGFTLDNDGNDGCEAYLVHLHERLLPLPPCQESAEDGAEEKERGVGGPYRGGSKGENPSYPSCPSSTRGNASYDPSAPVMDVPPCTVSDSASLTTQDPCPHCGELRLKPFKSVLVCHKCGRQSPAQAPQP